MYNIDDDFDEFPLVNFKRDINTTFNFIVRFDNELADNRKIKLKLKENLIFDSSYLSTNLYIPGRFQANKKIIEEDFGSILLEFINNYNQIINFLKNFSKKIKQSFKTISDNIKPSRFSREPKGMRACRTLYFRFYEELNKLSGMNNCITIIKNDILTFHNNLLGDTKKEYFDCIHGLNSMKYQLQKCSDTNSKVYEDLICYIEILNKAISRCNGIKLYEEQWRYFITNYIKELKHIYLMTINSFYTNNNNNLTRETNKFIGNNLDIPVVKLTTDTNNKKNIIEYNYTVNSFKDVANATLYHMIINNNVITRCNYCNTYFIPRTRNDEIYCHKLIKISPAGFPVYCSDIAKTKKYENKLYNVYKLYKALNDRLTVRIKKNDENKNIYERMLHYLRWKYEKITTRYQEQIDNINTDEKNYESIKNKIYENKRKELRNFLVRFDKCFQKKYPIIKGKKYDTQKYWTENIISE